MASPAKRLVPAWFPLAGFCALVVVCALAFALYLADARLLPRLATSPLERGSMRGSAVEGDLRIWFFDVGQGDAILVEAPTGEQLLVDGGPDEAVLAKLGQALPPTDRSLDAVLLTHPHADHVAGLMSVLERYDVARVYESGAMADSKVMDTFEADVLSEGAERHAVFAGDEIPLGAVTVQVVAPPTPREGTFPKDANEASVVLLVRYGDTSVLLTGDEVAANEAAVAALAGDIDVLKAGHHGSRTSSSAPFLAAVRPETAVISCGAGNRYGHPHAETLARLRDAGARVLRTDLAGDILVRSSGGEPSVEAAPLPF